MESSPKERLQTIRSQSVTLVRFSLGLGVVLMEGFAVHSGLRSNPELLISALAIFAGVLLVSGVQVRRGVLLLVPLLLASTIHNPELYRTNLIVALGMVFTWIFAEVPHPLEPAAKK